MKKAILLSTFIMSCIISFCQYIQVDHRKTTTTYFTGENKTLAEPPKKPELFKNGFLDFLDNGSIQASARVLRINIGEPTAFHIPFLIYSGITGQAFGENVENKTTIASLLNPVGGVANFSFSNDHNLLENPDVTYTKLKVSYQVGSRLLNGTDTINDKNTAFFNGFANLGLYFQTGAWEEGTSTIGIFWIQAKATASLSSKSKLESFFGQVESNYFYGYNLDAGLEINGLINFKLSVHQYVNNKDISLLDKPLVKFSLDYTFKK